MASMVASSAAIVPVASLASSSGSSTKLSSSLRAAPLVAGKSSLQSKTVSNGSRVNCMQVLNPYTNTKYETLSYLPPLTSDQIAKQVDYLISKGWIPCLEFDKCGSVSKESFPGSGYYDGRYWTMWKLPMFGCKSSAQVLAEIEECRKAYPDCCVFLALMPKDKCN